MILDNYLLNEYAAMKAEVRDLRRRISSLKHEMKKASAACDDGKGVKGWKGRGSVRVTGYPPSLFHKKQEKMMELVLLLECREVEFLDRTLEVERFIEAIAKSEMRIMFRLYYIEDFSYIKVADEMNQMFPRRSIAYTDENVKKRIQRFLAAC